MAVSKDRTVQDLIRPDYTPGHVPPAEEVLSAEEMARARELDHQLSEAGAADLSGPDRLGHRVSSGVRSLLHSRPGYRSVATDVIGDTAVATIWGLDLLEHGTPWRTAVVDEAGSIHEVAWSSTEEQALEAHRRVAAHISREGFEPTQSVLEQLQRMAARA